MYRRPPSPTRTDQLVPYSTRYRSADDTTPDRRGKDDGVGEGRVGIGSELLLGVDDQRAGGGGHEAADGEGGELHPHRGDPVGLPSALVVPDRDEHSTGAAPTNPAEIEGRDREHREAHVVQAGDRKSVG